MSVATAIQGRNLLSFIYDGFRRTVEPHVYSAWTRRATRRFGPIRWAAAAIRRSTSGEAFHANEMHGVTVQPQTFTGPRPGYKRGDKAFASIRAQL